MKFKVMTFNLRVDSPTDHNNAWSNRADKVAEMIVKHDPIIFGIQEGLYYMLTDLDERLYGYHWFGQGRDGGDNGEFSAIFYKKDVVSLIEEGQFWLSENPYEPGSKSWGTACPRVCTWGHFTFEQESEKEFSFYNTHLDHISQEAREKGIQIIWDKIMAHRQQKKRTVFLTGDLNAPPENNVIKFLKDKEEMVDSYSILTSKVGSTFHGFSGGTKGHPIDYIFVTKDVHLQNTIVDRSKVNGGFPSDHYPVILFAARQKG
jgi:endonuclease/exonuclease/phosphatase family metal-dependent hydrolase